MWGGSWSKRARQPRRSSKHLYNFDHCSPSDNVYLISSQAFSNDRFPLTSPISITCFGYRPGHMVSHLLLIHVLRQYLDILSKYFDLGFIIRFYQRGSKNLQEVVCPKKVNIDLELAVAPFSSNSGSGQSGIWRLSSKLVQSVIIIVVMVVMDVMVMVLVLMRFS